MLNHVHTFLSRFGKFLDEIPQAEYIEPQFGHLGRTNLSFSKIQNPKIINIAPQIPQKPTYEEIFLDSERNQILKKILFLSCSDHEAAPHTLHYNWLQKAKILMTFGNIIPRYEEANPNSRLFETLILSYNLKNIVVFGHTKCKTLECLLTETHNNHASHDITVPMHAGEIVETHYAHCSKEEKLNIIAQVNVLTQIDNLMTYPRIKAAIEHNKIIVHAWIYETETNDYFIYDPETEQFEKGDLDNTGF